MRLEDFAGERCERCGAPFEATKITQRFCCEACRYAAHLAVRRVPKVAMTCPECGTQFETGNVRQQKFCSKRCKRRSGNRFMGVVRGEEARRARSGKTCVECGAKFDGTRSTQRFCGRRCRDKAWRAVASNTRRRTKQRFRDGR